MDDESRVADLAYRDPLNEERWDYFFFRNLRHSSKLVDLNNKYLGKRDNQNIPNLNEIHRRFLKRRKRILDGEKTEQLGAVSYMKDIDLNNPGRYKIQKRQVQDPKERSSHINYPKIAESDTISSDRKHTHRDHTHSRHSNNAPQSSKKFESSFQSGGTTEHAAATDDKQKRHGTVHRHRHSGHSSRLLPDSSTNVMTETEAAEQYASQKEDGYQNEDLQHFDARMDSNSNIHPDQTAHRKHANIQAASIQSYRQGFETFIQNLDVKNAKGLYAFNMEDASDRHIPRLDDIPIYMQHVYLLLSKEDDKELMGGQMPTIRAVKLSPDNSSQIPEVSFHLTGLITHTNISHVDLVFEKPGCENLPSHLEIVIEVNPEYGQKEAPYQEQLWVSQYLSFYKADMSLFVSSLMKDNITLVLRQVGDIDKDCFQHPLLVTYKDFDMIQNRQQRSTNSGADTTNSSENIERESMLFRDIMTFGYFIEQKPNPSPCKRINWSIDMRLFNFSWYLGPTYIETHSCSGDCSYPLTDASLNATNYSFLKTMYHEFTNYRFVSELSRATCVPISYRPQSIFYIDEDNIWTLKTLPYMRVKDCGCR
ncbi:hypothetical protein CHS0354_036674 [Potamilus streckersoni]|uniref:TGF-beta family profile domain-containing protein n=1 Tax=Potamilus streckersoni TaxID=2493646 RepID=A0AAE0THB9_9BIVA|nr:hypothetical protein CHS0354_036674 [Potamilus streckersoni]